MSSNPTCAKMREGELKKNVSNRRPAPNSHSPRKNNAKTIRQMFTDFAFSGDHHDASGRLTVAGTAGGVAASAASAGSVGVSTEVIELHREFVPEGVVEPPELRQVVHIENIAR